jgi:hypothetical protein
MSILSRIPNGIQVRHEAFIKKRKINTLYGTIRDGYIETDELGCFQRFKHPLEFIKYHKQNKIYNPHRQSICGNPWKIVEYYDISVKEWKSLKCLLEEDVNAYEKDSESTTVDTTANIYNDSDDDCKSFITCVSDLDDGILEQPEIYYQNAYPYLITYQHIDDVKIWQTTVWIHKDILESWNSYQELLQDFQMMEEIEDEIAYDSLDSNYPWITRYNLPYEEELWIALKAQLPHFGEVWLTQQGYCWEVSESDKSVIGSWIGKWSWEQKIMDLGAVEPKNLIGDDEFWDILQDFDEPV